MWFKLAGADFSKNNLGTMSSISSSYLINYSKLTGMSGTPTSVSYAGSSAGTAKSVEVTITVTSGYSFKNGSKITASGGATGAVFTADKDYVGGNTFKFSMNITGNVELTGAAEAVSTGGGSSSGGGGEVIDPTPDGTMTLSAFMDSVNASSTTYKFLNGEVSFVGGEKYRHCIVPLSSYNITHVKIATGTEASGVAGLLYLSSGEITSSSIVQAVYGTDTTFVVHSTFRGLDTDISAPSGATHIAIAEFIDKATIGCTDADLTITIGSE